MNETTTIPLSPEQFSGAPPPPQLLAADAEFTDADRATMQYALSLLKAARKQAASHDAETSAAGKKQLRALIGYLVGFCDSRGLSEESSVKPGFETVFGEKGASDLDTSLDELEASLQSAVTSTRRVNWTKVAHAVGDACIAVGAGLLLL